MFGLLADIGPQCQEVLGKKNTPCCCSITNKTQNHLHGQIVSYSLVGLSLVDAELATRPGRTLQQGSNASPVWAQLDQGPAGPHLPLTDATRRNGSLCPGGSDIRAVRGRQRSARPDPISHC